MQGKVTISHTEISLALNTRATVVRWLCTQEWHERTERSYVQPKCYGKAVSVYNLWHMVMAYGGPDAVRASNLRLIG